MNPPEDFFEVLRRTLRHWKMILALVLLAAGAAVAYTYVVAKKYTSQTQLFVSTQGPAAAADALSSAYSGSQFSTARVQSYVDLVSSPEISNPVIRQLGLKMSQKQFNSEVSAEAPLNTVLLNITVTDTEPLRAQRIASAVAQQYIQVIHNLETTPGQTSPVRVTVSSPAVFPEHPSAPRRSLDVALGALVGLLLGFGSAQLVERLDNSVEDDEEVDQAFGLQVLSHIPYDPAIGGVNGALASSPTSGHREAVRVLRTALRFVDVDKPPKSLLVTSCRPGDGKTTTSASLAAAMADQGQNVVLVEADLRRPKLSQYLGEEPGRPGVAEVLGGEKKFEDVVIVVTRDDGESGAGKLDLLPAGTVVPNPSELLGSHRMQGLITALESTYDFVIIDASPVLPVADAVVLSAVVDGVLFVLEPGRTSRKELSRSLALLAQVDARLLGAVVNDTSHKKRSQYGYGYGYGYEMQV